MASMGAQCASFVSRGTPEHWSMLSSTLRRHKFQMNDRSSIDFCTQLYVACALFVFYAPAFQTAWVRYWWVDKHPCERAFLLHVHKCDPRQVNFWNFEGRGGKYFSWCLRSFDWSLSTPTVSGLSLNPFLAEEWSRRWWRRKKGERPPLQSP